MVCVCVCVCVCEQETVTVAAAEAAPMPEATSGTAPDSEPDEPKDTEMEETVSHHRWCDNYLVENRAAVLEISVHSDLTGCRLLAALILTSLCKWCIRDLPVLLGSLEEFYRQPCFSFSSPWNSNQLSPFSLGVSNDKKSSKHKKKKQKKEKEEKEKKKKKKHHHHHHHSDGGGEESVQNGTVEEEEPLPVSVCHQCCIISLTSLRNKRSTCF